VHHGGLHPPYAFFIRALTKGRRRCFRCFRSEFTASGARSAAEILERVGLRTKITANKRAVLRCFPLFPAVSEAKYQPAARRERIWLHAEIGQILKTLGISDALRGSCPNFNQVLSGRGALQAAE
jgi:hypothetical protein